MESGRCLHLIFKDTSHIMHKQYMHACASVRLLLLVTFLTVSAHAQSGSVAVNNKVLKRRELHEAILSTNVDSIVVIKHFRHMYVFHQGALLKVYNIVLGESPIGAKHFQGDRKTPEGQYNISRKNARSMAHKALGISYPNDADRKYARRYGKPTGGDVMIHGILNGHEAEAEEWMKSDWTWGCIAVTNADIDELFEHVDTGIPINILP